MIKLTVLYNLPPDADHEEFLKWRTGPHQKSNTQMPGLLKTDFYAVFSSREGTPPYRYITELYFPDQETFESAFYDEDFQAGLDKSLERVADPVFLISREVLTEKIADDRHPTGN
jgi:uncharacterized protein (TIGR02118 family)